MSEERTVSGLTPRPRRAGSAAILARPASEQPPAQTNEPEEREPVTADPVSAAPKPAAAARKPAQVTAQRAKEPEGAMVQLGVKVSEELRGRARAAFREASYHEGVPTFAQLIANALEAEILRIEHQYNGGMPLEPNTNNLRRGRPAAQ